jgi:hypothetical protein
MALVEDLVSSADVTDLERLAPESLMAMRYRIRLSRGMADSYDSLVAFACLK